MRISYVSALRVEVLHTKLLTIILESPLPAEGPLGTPVLTVPRAALVFFLIPPTGAAGTLAGWDVRRPPRPGRRAVFRRVLRISSRDWSSFSDILKGGERVCDKNRWNRLQLKRAAEVRLPPNERKRWSSGLRAEAAKFWMAKRTE
jgi:hypothetical protein